MESFARFTRISWSRKSPPLITGLVAGRSPPFARVFTRASSSSSLADYLFRCGIIVYHFERGVSSPNSPTVMPGSKSGDRSPSTENVGGLYIGSVLSENGLPTSPPVPEGFGRMEWDNDVTYEGEWSSGLHHGEGSKIHRNGGGYSGSWNMGQRCGRGSALYGGKWGYDRWEGNFVNDLEEGEGTLFLLDGTEKNLQYEAGDLVGDVPCNEEYEKSVFFRRLNEDTTDDTIMTLLSEFGPLDYCYIARDAQGVSNKIGRAKFRPVSNPANDKHLNKTERILSARQRAVDNARAAVEGLDKANIDSSEIRVHLARKADMKEFVRYGDY